MGLVLRGIKIYRVSITEVNRTARFSLNDRSILGELNGNFLLLRGMRFLKLTSSFLILRGIV